MDWYGRKVPQLLMTLGFHTESYPVWDTEISFGLLMSALLGSATQMRTAHGPVVQNTQAKTPMVATCSDATLDRCTTWQSSTRSEFPEHSGNSGRSSLAVPSYV